MADATGREPVGPTRRQRRLARRRRSLRRQASAVLAVAVLVLVAFGAAELTRQGADPAQTVVAAQEPASAPTSQPAPTSPPTATPATATPATATSTTATSTTAPTPASLPTPEPSATDCYAVRDAGGGPIRRGERGYALHLDDDRDGLACEYLPWR